MRQLVGYIVILVLISSCTSEKPSVVSKPEAQSDAPATQASPASRYGLDITPRNPNRTSVFNLIPRGFYLTEAAVTWFVNGSPVAGAAPSHLEAASIPRGTSVYAAALLRGEVIRSPTVQIGNTPPDIKSLKFVPEVFKPGDRLSVDAIAVDVDEDKVAFTYEWTRNGQPAGKGKDLEAPLKRGDSVQVTVTPSDGTDAGQPASIQLEIGNTPPVITEHREFSFDGTVYTYQVKASDADGDTLTFSLEGGADGMTIDSSRGMLTWTVPPDFKGKKPVTVVVSDGNGGTARYGLEITIQ